MTISFYDFKSLHSFEFSKKILSGFQEIIENSSFIDGQYNLDFENSFAKLQGSKHCLLVANGTDALEISLKVSGVGHGDLVAVSALTFHATAEAVLNIGASPIFIDIEPESGQMSSLSLKKALLEYEIKAVIPVDIYGIPAPLEEILSVVQGTDCIVIEDAAQAVGAKYRKTKGEVGSLGHLTTFSFYPTKNLGAFGDAGGILTDDDQISEMIKSLRNHGRGSDLGGRNSRCDSLQAYVLSQKIDSLSSLMFKRRQASKRYLDGLKVLSEERVISTPLYKFCDISSLHLFPILMQNSEQRDSLKSYLDQKKIETRIFYDCPLGGYSFLESFVGETPIAMDWSKRVLCLPMHPFLREEEIDFVNSEIKEFFHHFC